MTGETISRRSSGLLIEWREKKSETCGDVVGRQGLFKSFPYRQQRRNQFTGIARRIFGSWAGIRILACTALGREQLLNALDRIAFPVEQGVDLSCERDIGRPVIAAVSGPLQGAELRKPRLPVSQNMLGNAKFPGKFTDRPEGAFAFLGPGH